MAGHGPIISSWIFGDGSSSISQSINPTASHTYSTPGRYRIVLTVQSSFGSSSCSIVQIIHYPLTSPASVASSTIIHSGTRSFNVNPDNDTITAINESDLTKAWEVPVGRDPQTLAESPNGDIWVVNQGDATISIIRPTDGSLLDSIILPYASRPYGIAFGPDGSAAYVTLQGTGRLLKLDASGNIIGDINIGPRPRGIAISGDSRRILVTRFISPADHGEVREVDGSTFRVVRNFGLAFDPGPDTEASGRGVPNYVSFVSITPDGKRALVPSKKDNVARGLFRDGQALTFESRVRAIVSQIDLKNNVEDLAGRIDLNDRNMPQSVVFSPVGDIFFVAIQGNNLVEVYDANNLALLGGMNTGLAPQGMALNSDASKLYVHNFMSRTVSIFDITDFIEAVNNSATKLAEIPTVMNETLPPQVLLGKQIFYNAADPRMSRDGYISCASCHAGGGNDGQVWDFTQSGEGLRNTISLLGRAGLRHGNLHWTANFDEVQDFENDIRESFGSTGFLSDTDFNNTSDPLGKPKAGLSPDLDALAAYVASLTTTPPSPYRNPDGTLTADGQAGRQVFVTKNCQSCHSGPSFTDKQRHNVGTIQASSGLGIGQPLDGLGFETPTLKGAWNTAPYLHNGQADTLLEVLSNPDHGDTRGLTTTEMDQLIAYLLQIDDNEAPVEGTIGPTTLMPSGRIEAEHYKAGGEGVGYHDTTSGNSGGQYRSDDVDIAAIGSKFAIGWIKAREWLAFDVNVAHAGNYDVTARVASPWQATKTLHIEVDGQDVTGPISFTDSSGWTTWLEVTAKYVPLPAGSHELRLVMDTGSFNIDYLDVTTSSSAPNQPPIVNAGPDLVIALSDNVSLHGTVTDDGLPNLQE
jgi:DNA-binding beta-propeller fold protein YncE